MSDPITFISNLAEVVGQLEYLLRAVVFAIGLLLVIQALRLAAKRVEFGSQSVSTVKIFTSFIVGIALLSFPQTIGVFLGTIFGVRRPDDPSSIFAYGGEILDPISMARPAIRSLIVLIQFIGFIAIARGLLFLNAAANAGGPSSLGPGITFIVAGTLAVNFPTFFGALVKLFTT